MRLGKTKLPSNRSFGLFMTAVAAALAAYFWVTDRLTAAAVAGLVALFAAAIVTLRPNLLAPFNKAWMGLGMVLGTIVSPVVLGLLYFGLFTPLALLLRLFGRDELRLRRAPSGGSYWHLREPPGPQADSFPRQF